MVCSATHRQIESIASGHRSGLAVITRTCLVCVRSTNHNKAITGTMSSRAHLDQTATLEPNGIRRSKCSWWLYQVFAQVWCASTRHTLNYYLGSAKLIKWVATPSHSNIALARWRVIKSLVECHRNVLDNEQCTRHLLTSILMNTFHLQNIKPKLMNEIALWEAYPPLTFSSIQTG